MDLLAMGNQDKVVRKGIWATSGLVLAILVSVWRIGGRIPPEIPMVYCRPWGEGQLAGRQILWWMAGWLGGAGALALILGMAMVAGQKTIARIIVWTAVLIEVLGFLAVWNVWWRVGT